MRSSNVPFDSFKNSKSIRPNTICVRSFLSFDLEEKKTIWISKKKILPRTKYNAEKIYFFLSKRLESRVVIVPNRSKDKFATCRFEQRGTTTTTKLRDLIKPRSTKFHLACTKRCNSLEAQIPVSPAARMRSVRGSRTGGGGDG